MTTQQQEQKPPRPKSDLQRRLESFESKLTSPKVSSQLAKALPNATSVSQEIELVKNMVRRNSKLLMCTSESLFAAVVQVFELGLTPTPALGHAYFIPFQVKGRMICQLVIGYRGYIELARRSGTVSSIRAEAVFENDYFRYRLGLEPQLDHVPFDVIQFDDVARAAKRGQQHDGPGRLVAAYCVVSLKDGTKEFRVVTDEYVRRVKKVSRGSDKDDSPWKNWEDQMWSKTAIRHTLKFVPLSPEDRLVKGLDVDERAFADIGRSIETTGTDLDGGEQAAGKGRTNGHARAPQLSTPSTTATPEIIEDLFGDGTDEEQGEKSGLDTFVAKQSGGDASTEMLVDKSPQQQEHSESAEQTESKEHVDPETGEVTPTDPTQPDGSAEGSGKIARRRRRPAPGV